MGRVAVQVGLAAIVFAGLVYLYRPAERQPARKLTSRDVVCDADSRTITIMPGIYLGAIIDSAVKACGWSLPGA